MPVYNTPEDRLYCSVRSVLNQTYRNFELVIVDDGSEPKCATLCDTIKQLDTRIAILHQNNAGVSMARNIGTRLSIGNYVMYMDSDDYLAPYALEEGVSVIQKTYADFLFAAIQHIRKISDFAGSKNDVRNVYTFYDKNHIDCIRHSFFTQRNPQYNNVSEVGFVNRGPCARFVAADIAKTVTFNEKLKLGEDVDWNMRVLNACSSAVYVPSIWYGYLIYENSSLRRYYGNRAELLASYHNELYSNNREYCDNHPEDYAMNMAVSFYSMVQFEYLSKEAPLTSVQKNKEIAGLLKQEPWCILVDRNNQLRLPLKYKVFLGMCKCGIGVSFLKLREDLLFWKRKLR